MIYRECNKLTVIDLEDNAGCIAFDRLARVICERPSNVIYCRYEGKLSGIITMGDIARASDEGMDCVSVNRKFTCILNRKSMEARKIFRAKNNINAIPVINENNVLLGDYSRWDDLLSEKVYSLQKPFSGACMQSRVAIVRPCKHIEEKQRIFQAFHKCFSSFLNVEIIDFAEIPDYVDKMDWILLTDEDEWRAVDTLLTYILHKIFLREKFMIFGMYIKYRELEAYLCDIKEKEIHLLNLVFRDNECSSIFRNDISDKFSAVGCKVNNVMPVSLYSDFFDDLYTPEYADNIIHMVFSVESESGCGKLKDCRSRFYNVKGGERHTVGQPLKFNKTIYFIGPCFIYGHYTEDKNTVESILQGKINAAGYEAKVVNLGSPKYSRGILAALACIREIPFKKGDILVFYLENRSISGISELNLMDILKDHKISAGWVVDDLRHCNHKVNAIYADVIYDRLREVLPEVSKERGEVLEGGNEDFVKALYIDRYFTGYDFFIYEKVGSIVMNCNPFTYGHRYLIEHAANIVDLLIVFVVEEDKSVFSFSERFTMVYHGVSDLENVMVVPSGPFILSQTTFPEYFIKTADEDLVVNVENDIKLFAERIAPHLNIRYRFVGEEPEDMVTNEYNLAMKRILPKYGIEIIEVPRKKQDGRYISASSVRRCLEENNIARLEKLVPESAMRVLL